MVDGVIADVEVPLTVADDVGVVEAVVVAVALEESEILEDIDAEAPFEIDPVGVRDIELERL